MKSRLLLPVPSRNPVNVSIFPQTVAYVEITADNQIVGAIPIPSNIY